MTLSSSSKPPRVMVVFGTRPESIKLAPVIRELVASPIFVTCLVSTGQHRGMLDQVTRLFSITPDVDLDLMRDRQTLVDTTCRALGQLDRVVAEQRPDLIVVQGDTLTTFTGALAGYCHQIPVAHLEAGLRTDERYSPFPEEMNRRLTTQLASLHLAPTQASRENLVREGVDPSAIVVTGNTVIDALLWVVRTSKDAFRDPTLAERLADGRRVLLVTAHRRESWGEPLVAIGRAIAEIARREPDLLVVLPLHANPVVRECILPAVDGLRNVLVTDPLAYGDFVHVLSRAHLVLTDSGGVQEEAPSLGKPVLVMRRDTERPEGVVAGTARLVGTDEEAIVTGVVELLHDEVAYERMSMAVSPYGDGRAAERTMAALKHFMGLGPPPEPFVHTSRLSTA